MSITDTNPESAALSVLGGLATSLLAGHSTGEGLSFGAAKSGLRDLARRDPLDTLAVTVLGGSYLFYLAEQGKNPKCESFFDALVFITTSLSVGYSDIFPKTDAGKAIASFVMTFGPAISAAALEPPGAEVAAEAKEGLDVQKAILAKLETIAAALAAEKPTL